MSVSPFVHIFDTRILKGAQMSRKKYLLNLFSLCFQITLDFFLKENLQIKRI